MVSSFLRSSLLLCFFTISVAAAIAPMGKARDILKEAGLADKDIQNVLNGKLFKRVLDSTNEREIGMFFAILIKETPEQVKDIFISLCLKAKTDPDITAYAVISEHGTIRDFDTLTLEPNGDAAAKALIHGASDDELNLSSEEKSALNQLKDGKGKEKTRVEKTLREMLLHRYESYKKEGLAGILPYARNGGDYKPGEDLGLTKKMSSILQQKTPDFYKHLVNFPANRPDGLEESYSWVSFGVDGKPNMELLHRMGSKENDVFVFSERQYYVMSGYNCVHGEGGAIPSEAGTLLLFTSRTSTDAVTGRGGTIKRAVGVRMMGNMVSEILDRYQLLEGQRGDEL